MKQERIFTVNGRHCRTAGSITKKRNRTFLFFLVLEGAPPVNIPTALNEYSFLTFKRLPFFSIHFRNKYAVLKLLMCIKRFTVYQCYNSVEFGPAANRGGGGVVEFIIITVLDRYN